MKVNEKFAAENRRRIKQYEWSGEPAVFLCVHCGDEIEAIPFGLIACAKCEAQHDEEWEARRQRNLERLTQLQAREADLVGQPDIW